MIIVLLKFLASLVTVMSLGTFGFVLANNKRFLLKPAFYQAFLVEWYCLLVVVCLRPWQFINLGNAPYQAIPEKAIEPIVLVHGYLHNTSAWLNLSRRFKRRKQGPIYNVQLKPVWAPIREQALCIQAKVEEIMKLYTEHAGLTLIGHSMGGLASSYYAENMAKDVRIKRVITLGSPLQGTQLACLGIGPNAREMRIGSDFTKNLIAQIKVSKIPYYCIASKLDNLVVPWQNALPGFPVADQLVLENHGHIRLLISKQVADFIQGVITKVEVN